MRSTPDFRPSSGVSKSNHQYHPVLLGRLRIYMSDFVYENMTPELMAYLGHNDRPLYLYPRSEDGKTISGTPTPESQAAVDAWQAEHNALKAKCGEGEPHAYYQAHKVWLCREETQVEGSSVEHLSPSGKYRLVVTKHGTGPGTWDYSKGRVYAGDKLITTVCRNYGAFPFAWVEGHPKGSFLLAGEDYQGQTVIDLVAGERKDFLPKEAADGAGFCWAKYTPNSDGMLLAVEGCYWACPYEVRIVDFSDPMNPPWPILHRDEDNDTFGGWTGLVSCTMGMEFEVVDLPGHALDGKKQHELSPEDWADIDRVVAERNLTGDDPGWKKVFIPTTWTRG